MLICTLKQQSHCTLNPPEIRCNVQNLQNKALPQIDTLQIATANLQSALHKKNHPGHKFVIGVINV
jgi:hypothetical protein